MLPLPEVTLPAVQEGEMPAAPFHGWELGRSLASRGPAVMESCYPTASSAFPSGMVQGRLARRVTVKRDGSVIVSLGQ